MPVARDHLCGDRFGHESETGARDPLHLGVAAAVDPDRPEIFPTLIPARARSMRSLSRSSSKAQPASLAPKVIGSAWTP